MHPHSCPGADQGACARAHQCVPHSESMPSLSICVLTRLGTGPGLVHCDTLLPAAHSFARASQPATAGMSVQADAAREDAAQYLPDATPACNEWQHSSSGMKPGRQGAACLQR